MNKPLTVNTLDFVQEEIPLSNLLPYTLDESHDEGAHLRKGLTDYLFLLKATEETIEAIQRDDLSCFDPLVGENACQIRALWFAHLFQENSCYISRHLNIIKHARKIVESILNSDFSRWRLSLPQVIEKENLEIKISLKERFLIQSYVLTKVRVYRAFDPNCALTQNEYTDMQKIKEISKVGSRFACKIVRDFRIQVASYSVNYIQSLANQSSVMCDQSYRMVSDHYAMMHKGLKCLPCFWMTKALLNEAIAREIPLVLIANQVAKDENYKILNTLSLYFKPTPEGYKLVSREDLDEDEPVIIFKGKTCREKAALPSVEKWKNELLSIDPSEILLAHAASHRQYPDTPQNHLLRQFDNENYQHYKHRADEWGISLENPSLFFVYHAFCDRIKNVS